MPAERNPAEPGTSGRDARPPAIELRSISKTFGPVWANRDVWLAVESGSITGIVGENGAGKSTLMSILYGLYKADSGDIIIEGRPARIRNPHEAIAAGIGMVHQHFMLVETLTVLENVVLRAEQGPILRTDLAAARRELARLEREYGLRVDPDATVGDLPVGEQQRVEILKALYRGARILILDEPTGVLTPQETNQLFRILQALRDRGATVILITHKLREIMAVTDAVWVMRHGEVVAHRRTAVTNPEELAELMVGRKVRLQLDKPAPHPGEAVLVAEGIGLRDGRGVALLEGIDLVLRAGEIVGVAGVSGNGQSELLELLAGMRPPTTGRLVVAGREVTPQRPGDPTEMRRLGVAHVPEDRVRHAMVGAFEAAETSILGYHRSPRYGGPWRLKHDAVRAHCAGLMEGFDVRPRDPTLRSSSFSGGNQQKLVLAREIVREPRVLLVGQPTRGVDIGAVAFIHRQLIAMREAGCAVLLVSAELEEVMALADRILVMCGGRIVGTVAGAATDERTLGQMMANLAPGSREPASAGPGATS